MATIEFIVANKPCSMFSSHSSTTCVGGGATLKAGSTHMSGTRGDERNPAAAAERVGSKPESKRMEGCVPWKRQNACSSSVGIFAPCRV